MKKIEKILQDPKFDINKKDKKKSIPCAEIAPEPALIVHRDQLKSNKQIKEDVSQKIETRKKLADATSDEEFQELFNVVMGLIDKQDFWELIPDSIIQKCYAYIDVEFKKRAISRPTLKG